MKVPEKLADSNKKLGILYIDEDGSVKVIASNEKDGYISFATEHFSNYAIYTYEGAESPKTSSSTNIMELLGMLVASGGMTLTSWKKRRK